VACSLTEHLAGISPTAAHTEISGVPEHPSAVTTLTPCCIPETRETITQTFNLQRHVAADMYEAE